VGNLLRQIGSEVDIFERSAHDLDSRGGGVGSNHRTVFRPDGSILSKHLAPQTQTSWSLIYTTLKAAFGEQHYHQAAIPRPHTCSTERRLRKLGESN